MSSKVIVGIIIGIAIIVGISAIYLSSSEDSTLEDIETEIVPEPQGRNLTIELHESVGFSTGP